MGYCCIYAFFRLHKRTGPISATLGVSDRAVRYCKEKFRNGDYACVNAPTCLKGRLF